MLLLRLLIIAMVMPSFLRLSEERENVGIICKGKLQFFQGYPVRLNILPLPPLTTFTILAKTMLMCLGMSRRDLNVVSLPFHLLHTNLPSILPAASQIHR
jgi:hypothetical protein